MGKENIAYLFQQRGISGKALLRMKRTVGLASYRSTWYPQHYEDGKVPLALSRRKRVVRSILINPKRLLDEDGMVQVYIPGYGTDETGDLLPAVELDFHDGELVLYWLREDGDYEETRLPRDKVRKPKPRSRKAGRPQPSEK